MIDQEFPTVVANDFNYIDEPEKKRGGCLLWRTQG